MNVESDTSSSFDVLNLRFTISGGLEDLAMEELHQVFSSAFFFPRLFWIQKGNSGSQLGVEVKIGADDNVRSSSTVVAVADAICKLRFVEYAHFVVHSKNFVVEGNGDDNAKGDDNIGIIRSQEELLLSKIQTQLLSSMDPSQLKRATAITRRIQEALGDRSVGLEPLPGELLPTPTIGEDVIKEEDETKAVDSKGEEESSSFRVNTIYTKPAVAKVVVETFVQLVEKYRRHQTQPTVDDSTSHQKTLWLDAGAGSGALLRHLPSDNRLGIDIAPGRSSSLGEDDIVQANFLETTREFVLRGRSSSIVDIADCTICVISNPPFADGSRGDYSAITQFLNHSTRVLLAPFVGLIVPAKFARPRIWASLGTDANVRLLARFFLPQDSFIDPSSQKSVHIHSYFLFFGVTQQQQPSMGIEGGVSSEEESPFSSATEANPSSDPVAATKAPSKNLNTFYLRGKRDKGDFPGIATADLVHATALSLSASKKAEGDAGATCDPLRLGSERDAEFSLWVKVQKATSSSSRKAVAKLELWLLLNPERPFSLINSISSLVPQHSLGWMSTSVKPSVANAMMMQSTTLMTTPSTTTTTTTCALVVNAMSGEGTIELEAQQYGSQNSSFFLISGDKSETAAHETILRLSELQRQIGKNSSALIDLVIWDAQRLPIRPDVVDLFLADLPFAGSQTKQHQVPSSYSSSSSTMVNAGDTTHASLNYRCLMAQAVRILRPLGEATLISADTKTLVHSTGNFHWRSIPSKGINRINVGGLNAQLLIMKKLEPCSKDLSLWVVPGTPDLSSKLLVKARQSVAGFYLDNTLDLLHTINRTATVEGRSTSLVTDVKLVDEYYQEKSGRFSHCYRFDMDGLLTNFQAKKLEKLIRAGLLLEDGPSIMDDIIGLR